MPSLVMSDILWLMLNCFFFSLSLRAGCSTLSFCSVACRGNVNDILIVNLTFFDNGFSLIFSGCLNAVRLLSYRLEVLMCSDRGLDMKLEHLCQISQSVVFSSNILLISFLFKFGLQYVFLYYALLTFEICSVAMWYLGLCWKCSGSNMDD